MNLIAESMEIAAKLRTAQRALMAGHSMEHAAQACGLPVAVLADFFLKLQRAEERHAHEQRRAARHLLDEQTQPAPAAEVPAFHP